MRHNIVLVFLFSLALFEFGSVSANAQEQPSVLTQANAPGWITVSWEHTGQDVYYFVMERLDPPYAEDSAFLIARSNNRTDSVTDKNLKADTIYKYHVCAVYATSRTCSDWVSVRTLSPPPPSAGSGGTASPPPHPPLKTPELTATANAAFSITLGWNTDQIYEVKTVQLYRDGQLICDAVRSRELADGGCLYERRDIVPQANTKYKYKVCFVSLYYMETKCSEEITASGKPTAPTAPDNVNVSQNKSHGSATDLFARIRTLITASWRNTPIRGHFITLEREDKVQLDQVRFGLAWVEIKRIAAAGNPSDPTELTVDVTPAGPELTRQGNNYRVCAVVPALGESGKVCSSVVVAGSGTIRSQSRVIHPPGTTPNAPRPICESAADARERNNPAAPGLEQTCLAVKKGAALANQDPLALELRNQQPDDSARQGFDIGMAAAEGQTALGPGKEKTCADRQTAAEQNGCRLAVLFSVERNRNAQLAAKGAEIAHADQGVADLRNADTDVFYRLGFDIATGIFGNSALGARGNTATGPGSLGIRDALSAAGQRGFNASVKLHLSRKY